MSPIANIPGTFNPGYPINEYYQNKRQQFLVVLLNNKYTALS